eukprot:17610-Alexandrium_andersonii.AAC.1
MCIRDSGSSLRWRTGWAFGRQRRARTRLCHRLGQRICGAASAVSCGRGPPRAATWPRSCPSSRCSSATP